MERGQMVPPPANQTYGSMMWEVWQFSPELKDKLLQFAGPSPHLLFRDDSRKLTSHHKNEEGIQKVESSVEEEATKVEHPAEETTVDYSILLTAECVAESLKERNLTNEELSSVTVEQLSGLSEIAVYNLCQSVCAASPTEQNRLSTLLCRDILSPRVCEKNVSCGRPILAALRLIADTFPEEWCTHILTPIFSSPSGNHTMLETVLAEFSPTNKQIALRYCLENAQPHLREWQIPALQSVVTRLDDARATSLLVGVLSASAPQFVKSIKFGKLLVVVIEHLGSALTPLLKEQLKTTVAEHKSAVKGIAFKLLKTLA